MELSWSVQNRVCFVFLQLCRLPRSRQRSRRLPWSWSWWLRTELRQRCRRRLPGQAIRPDVRQMYVAHRVVGPRMCGHQNWLFWGISSAFWTKSIHISRRYGQYVRLCFDTSSDIDFFLITKAAYINKGSLQSRLLDFGISKLEDTFEKAMFQIVIFLIFQLSFGFSNFGWNRALRFVLGVFLQTHVLALIRLISFSYFTFVKIFVRCPPGLLLVVARAITSFFAHFVAACRCRWWKAHVSHAFCSMRF